MPMTLPERIQRLRRSRWLAPVLLLALWAVWWWPVIAGQMQLFIRDLTFYALPMKTVMMQRFHAGAFPFWAPLLSGGMPFFAEPSHQVLYPLNLLFFITPTAVHGISWMMILQHLLGMGALFFLVRVLGCSRMAALWSAVLYGLSGYTLSITDNVNYMPAVVWVPLTLAFLIRGYERRSLRDSVCGALCVSMMVLAGDAFHPFFLALLAVLWALLRMGWPVLCNVADAILGNKHPPRPVPPWQAWVWMLTHGLIVFGLAGVVTMVQLLPTWELTRLSVRQTPMSYDEVTLWSFPPQRLIEWVVPFFYGSKYGTYNDAGPHFLGMFLYPSFREPWADSIYLGLIPVLMAGVGVWLQFRRSFFWLVMAGFGLFFAFGLFAPYYPTLLQWFPPISYHRYVEKFLFFTNVALCVLAGLGAASLPVLTERWQAFWSVRSYGLVWRVALSLLLLVGGVWLLVKLPADAWIWPHEMERSAEWENHFYDRGLHVFGMVGHMLLILLALGAALWVPVKRMRRYLMLLLLAALVDLGSVHWAHVPLAPTALLTHRPQPAALQMIEADHPPEHWRLYYDDMAGHEESYYQQTILGEIGKAYGLGYTPDYFNYYWIYRVMYNQQRLLFNEGMKYGVAYQNGRFAPLQPKNHKLYDVVMTKANVPVLLAMSGVRYVVSPLQERNPVWDTADFTEVGRDPGFNFRVMKLNHALPRAYLAPNAVYNIEPMQVYRMLTPDFRGRPLQEQVEVHRPPGFGQAERPKVRVPLVAEQPGHPQVTFTADHPEQVAMSVESPYENSFLVLNEGFFPGWQAVVDDQPVSLNMVNQRMMGVPLHGKGPHTVAFHYTSTYFLPGLWLSLFGLALAAAFVWLENRACVRRWFEYNGEQLDGGCRQVVKAPDCGSGIRGFESHHPPHLTS